MSQWLGVQMGQKYLLRVWPSLPHMPMYPFLSQLTLSNRASSAASSSYHKAPCSFCSPAPLEHPLSNR